MEARPFDLVFNQCKEVKIHHLSGQTSRGAEGSRTGATAAPSCVCSAKSVPELKEGEGYKETERQKEREREREREREMMAGLQDTTGDCQGFEL